MIAKRWRLSTLRPAKLRQIRWWTIAAAAGTIRRHRVAEEAFVDAPELTIVVPTFNEHDNIVPLLDRQVDHDEALGACGGIRNGDGLVDSKLCD